MKEMEWNSTRAFELLFFMIQSLSVVFLLSSVAVILQLKGSVFNQLVFLSFRTRESNQSIPLVPDYGRIDVVYTWVNGSDSEWLKSYDYYKQEYNRQRSISQSYATGSNRFQDNNELKYSLRSIMTNAPWIRNIYIVTNGQVPTWLNVSEPRIHIVTHEEIFIYKDALPTFSSFAIEYNFHRIQGLSEYFLYLNDDFFIASPVTLNDFMTIQDGQFLREAWFPRDCSPSCMILLSL